VRNMKVSTLMKEYFNRDQTLLHEAPGRQLPITPKKETWTRNENPESIRRLFRFQSTRSLITFLEDVIQMQEEVGHHGKLLIENGAVLAQVSTVSLQRVTELDIEWAAKVDDIYNDAVSVYG
jgi:pterin-4a-carbinolamine dehydratase